MNEVVCNYAAVRFLPYRETGEFVNLGVVVYCPEIDWFDFRLETRRTKRVHGFFPELDLAILRSSLGVLEQALCRRRTANELQLYGNRLDPKEAEPGILRFKELIRRRESLIHFGEPGVMMAADPRLALSQIFDDLVRRQFANPKEYQEFVMRKRLATWLKEWKFQYEPDFAVGDDEFRVRIPFVHLEANKPVKAIKPFDLDKSDSSEIYNHGDAWIAKMRRLTQRKCMPGEMVFTVRLPLKPRRRKIASAICKELQDMRVRIVEFDKRDEIRKAAFVEEMPA